MVDAASSSSPDCSRCFALCCVVPAFSRSADFAIDKPARTACPNLATDLGCGIHAELRPRGFAGCTTYDCFGAGQQVAQVTFGGRDRRESPATAAQMFDVFPVMRVLHELLWYLTEVDSIDGPQSLHDDVRVALRDIRRLTRATPDELAALDVGPVRDDANRLLSRVSDLVRARTRPAGGSPRRRSDRRDVSWRRSTGCEPACCLPDRCRSAWRRSGSGRRHRRRLQDRRPAGRGSLDDDLPAAVPTGRRAWR